MSYASKLRLLVHIVIFYIFLHIRSFITALLFCHCVLFYFLFDLPLLLLLCLLLSITPFTSLSGCILLMYPYHCNFLFVIVDVICYCFRSPLIVGHHVLYHFVFPKYFSHMLHLCYIYLMIRFIFFPFSHYHITCIFFFLRIVLFNVVALRILLAIPTSSFPSSVNINATY